MPWTWDQINNVWLAGNRIDFDEREAEDNFNRVERILGTAWVNGFLDRLPGTSPTLTVANAGRLLSALENVSHRDLFLEKLKANNAATWAELEALYLLRQALPEVRAAIADETAAPPGVRVPDIKIALGCESWTSVEVSRPEASDLYEQARTLLASLCERASCLPGIFNLEIFLHREITAADIDNIWHHLQTVFQNPTLSPLHLTDIAILRLHESPPGQITLQDYGGPVQPRLGMAKATVRDGQAEKSIFVRIPFSDVRAEKILKREAEQLPKDGPGLIMLDISNCPGSFKSWVPLILRRFQPRILTRVGAVCLFRSGQETGARGLETVRYETAIIKNPHSAIAVPTWIFDQLYLFSD